MNLWRNGAPRWHDRGYRSNLDSAGNPRRRLHSTLVNMFLIRYSPTRSIAACLLTIVMCMMQTGLASAQDRDDRREKKVQRLIDRVGKISPGLKQHVEAMEDDDESAEEIAEVCEEFLDEYDEIESERGAKAAGLWCELMEAELEVEKLVDQAEDDELDEAKLKEKILAMVDADTAFDATELALMDDKEEIEEFKEEIKDRRESREEEADEVLKEILDELGDTRDADIFERARAYYKPVQPVKVTAAEISTAGKWEFKTHVLPVLQNACYDCHGGGSNEGNLDIEDLLNQTPLVKNRERWNHVIAQIETRTMPPPDADKVADADRKILAAWLRDQLENFDFASVRNPGFESAKRLTHQEYNNTIRDLIGVDLRPADRLPADLSTSGGFDNNASSLFLHDGLLERYVGLAEFVVQQAYPIKKRTAQQQKAWELLFVATPGDGKSEVDAARAIFGSFLPRVYRTKIEASEIEAMVKRFEKYRFEEADLETDFHAAILKCVQTTLVSPRFLIRVETKQSTDQAFKIEAYELANRLSYFLWASMPDKRLFELALSLIHI